MSRLTLSILTALLLGGLVAAPAQGQEPGFGVYIDEDEADFFPQRITCMTDRQIREDIAARGYTNIALNVPNDKRVEVRATRDGWVYLIDFNFCSGSILNRMQLRPAS